MAAPTVTARLTPVGIMLQDGYVSHITFAADPDISFWERSVQPPGMDGGEPINLTTMFNNTYRTNVPRQLITLTPIKVVACYDPAVFSQIQALMNVVTAVTVLFPDGSTIAFWAFLQKFEPGELVEGKEPEATLTIVPTNYDPVNDVESDPVVTSVAGT